jgi:hypothetical protein
MTEDQANDLRQTADSEGTSQTEIVRRALQLVGAFSSGLSDVSENHDRYLAEAMLEENAP